MRGGGALVIALALLAICAALIAGSAATSRAANRSTLSHSATALAVSESQTAMADFMSAWGSAQETLAVGAELLGNTGPTSGGIGALSVTARTRLDRLTTTRYVLAIDCQVGTPGVVLASRRLYRILERPVPADTTAPPAPPRPIGQWSLADLY